MVERSQLYIATPYVYLREPLVIDDGGERPTRAIGYAIRLLIYACNHNEVASLVEAEITDGEVQWDKTSVWSPSRGELSEREAREADEYLGTGVCSRSGRAFFEEG